jgi:hypothetical protein
MKYINNTTTTRLGGGFFADLIHLKDGRVIAIQDNMVCVYSNEDALIFADANTTEPTHTIDIGVKQ